MGNHFCDWMFNNNDGKPPYFQCNLERYPNREEQLHFIRSYIKKFKEVYRSKHFIKEKPNDICDEHDLVKKFSLHEEQLIKEANYFALVSHIFRAFWAVCEAGNSEKNGNSFVNFLFYFYIIDLLWIDT